MVRRLEGAASMRFALWNATFVEHCEKILDVVSTRRQAELSQLPAVLTPVVQL
jgi:hypothetical protein